MNDSAMNPMKTGLMFVPPGLMMSSGRLVAPTEGVERAERCNTAGSRRIQPRPFAPSRLGGSAFRRLLERFGEVARRQQPSST